jgi:hypothetical protein
MEKKKSSGRHFGKVLIIVMIVIIASFFIYRSMNRTEPETDLSENMTPPMSEANTPEEAEAQEQAPDKVQIIISNSTIAKPSERCPSGTFLKTECEKDCIAKDYACIQNPSLAFCYRCEKQVIQICPTGLMTNDECKKGCTAADEKCIESERFGCYSCEKQEKEACAEGMYTNNCPDNCNECEYEKTLSDGSKCFTCIVSLCPENTYNDTCPQVCDFCNVIELRGDKQCFECKTYTCSGNSWKTERECEHNCDSKPCRILAEQSQAKCWGCS